MENLRLMEKLKLMENLELTEVCRCLDSRSVATGFLHMEGTEQKWTGRRLHTFPFVSL